MRILVAEPSQEVRELLVATLQENGHETETWQGEETWPAVPFDLLVGEPADATVLALAHRIRTARPDLPIIWVSVAPPSPHTRALDPAAHLVKPFSLSELNATVASLSPGG